MFGALVPLCLFKYVYLPICVRVFEEVPWLKAPLAEPEAGHEACSFQTADGLTLRGSYLRTTADQRLGVILFCHELLGDRWNALPYVESLRDAGYDIFTFDFRNHGQSDSIPGYEPIPWLTQYELTDVRAALDYLTSREDVGDEPIGIYGISRGGTAALCAAAGQAGVGAVLTDGAFPTLSMLVFYFRRYMGIYTRMSPLYMRLPQFYVRFLMLWTARSTEERRHCRFIEVERVGRRITQPVMMIHGAQDSYIPVEVAHEFRQRIPGAAEFWAVPNARHNAALSVAGEEYQQRVVDFFRQHVAACRPDVAVVHSEA